ncbi:MAG: hypothetical protein JNL66_26205 [Alphaproteobacteria bacterium]|nr:hypothetical protein [Alphaproteobacteria bacterium]
MADFPIEPGWGVPTQLREALGKAQPGDVVRLLPGEHRYFEPATLMRRSGAPGKPIVIRAERGAIVRGYAGPVPHLEWNLPDGKDWAFLRIIDSDHVRLEDVYFAECWPMAVFAEGSSHLTFSNCTGVGGTFLFVVRDRPPYGRVREIVVDGCSWAQDPRIWANIPWKWIHDNDRLYNYLDGGILGTGDIVGDVDFTNNLVADCYNGLVVDISPEFRRISGNYAQTNRNFHIAHNTFERVRDNPIEPEWHAFNWHIHHNTFVDCHSWFSLDNVRGGWWTIYANRGYFRSRPGSAIGDGHSIGEAFKLTDAKQPPEFGRVFVFNNSFRMRAPMFGNANDDEDDPNKRFYEFRNWTVADNAFEWCGPADGGARPVCQGPVDPFEPGVRFPGETRFDRTLTNAPRWQQQLAAHGQAERAHRYVGAPIFAAGGGGDFALVGEAAHLGAAGALAIVYPDGSEHTLRVPRRIGAADNDGADWPPFKEF